MPRCAYSGLISGNLLYHCDSGAMYFNWDEEPDYDYMFRNMVYEDNYILFTDRNNGLVDFQGNEYLQHASGLGSLQGVQRADRNLRRLDRSAEDRG